MRSETFRKIVRDLSPFGTFGARVSESLGENLTMYVAALSAVVLLAVPLLGMASTAFWIEDIVIDPKTPNVVYAGTCYAGLLKSTNNGESWTAVNKGLKEKYVACIAIDPVHPCTMYLGTCKYPHVARVEGETRPVDKISPPGSRSSLAASHTDTRCFYKSTNGAASWRALPKEGSKFWGDGVQDIAIDPTNTSVLYVAQHYGNLYASADGGNGWRVAGETFFSERVVVDPVRPSTVYAGNGWRLNKSTDYGWTWTQNFGTYPGCWAGLMIDPKSTNTLYAADIAGSWPGIWKSVNGGKIWKRTSFPDRKLPTGMALSPSKPNIIYASGFWKGLQKSTNRGASWSTLSTTTQYDTTTPIEVSPTDPDTVYVGGWGTIIRSTDGGLSWTVVLDEDGMVNQAEPHASYY